MDISVFFSELEAQLKGNGLETVMLKGEEPQPGDTLRVLVPIDEAGNSVLTELSVIPFTEDVHLLQIFTTVILEIGPGYEALQEKLADWNLSCPLGAYGIYAPLRQLYHKYNYLMPVGVPADEMAEEILDVLVLVWDVIGQILPEARSLVISH